MHDRTALLASLGLRNLGTVSWNLPAPALYEEAVRRGEGWISRHGPLVVHTGHHTGRSPNDKFIARDDRTRERVAWGKINRPMEVEKFDALYAKFCAFFQGRDLFVQDLYAGADPRYRIPVRVITDHAWHSLFARNLLREPEPGAVHNSPDTFTVIDSPRFHADPEADGTNSEVFIAVNFSRKLVIIGGTTYAGEIKKSVFTILNYLLPERGVFPMHCSANAARNGDTALFFGLSGTGKTTLSADPDRLLIGDDEHGWSDEGIFNFEGGCYAKVIRLSAEAEPEIFRTTRMFGTVLENVVLDHASRAIDLDNATLTENTRAAYPLSFIGNHVEDGRGNHPRHVIMLTCDASGVMPPIARLSPQQAMYYFLSGYTAKVAGTEKGLGKEPQSTFSTCFGAPFMPLAPTLYAQMLGERLARHGTTAWLVNTGWSGGPYGTGSRIRIDHTRALVRAALAGSLNDIPMERESHFGILVPRECPGVPFEILMPRNSWKDRGAYDQKAVELAGKFRTNFILFSTIVPPDVLAAGPR